MLNRHVLILNQNYEPMTVCTARRAIVLVYLGKAELIEKYDFYVQSVTRRLPVPSIVRLSRFVKVPPRRILLTKKNILKRDSYRCQYCGVYEGDLTVDHVIPKDRGGRDTWENLVACCKTCNAKKGNRTPEEVRMHLLKKPRRPNHLMFIQYFIGIADTRWKPYLYMSD
ncbi:CRISPR-associated endonuclease Cas9 [bacterium BMS3Abin05]|nr:CRISPR-associated endonuclease Cas9 [bacterium BMS3Abin05]GBE26190.1 CRISPR-associated endonuclease Cas9 [bacterium BMS3Bbin03]HDL78701.1 HNH endonuclease [Bacteroidota bacterium]